MINKNLGIVLITRIKSLNNEEVSDFKEWLEIFRSNDLIDQIYITAAKGDKEKLNLNDNKIEFKILDDPTSPSSMNFVIKELSKNTKYFIVASKEIDIELTHLENLVLEIQNKKRKTLVVGYKFKIFDNQKLDDELQAYYKNKKLVAYSVPWNTCAIWNNKLFKKYIGKFDEITARNPFNNIGVSIDGICTQTEHKGMEDGLAIAQAVSNKKGRLYFKLIDTFLSWKVTDKKRHREKLARKDTVMRNFMAVRNYSEDDLRDAEIEQ